MVWEYTFTAVGSGRGLRAVDEIERVARAICHFAISTSTVAFLEDILQAGSAKKSVVVLL